MNVSETLPSVPTAAIASTSPSGMTPNNDLISIDGVFDEVTRVPTSFEAASLSSTIPITSLLIHDGFPPLLNEHGVDIPSAESCIVDNPVNWTGDRLLQSPVPSRKWLGTLDIELNRRLRCVDGTPPVSLRHPTVTDLYVPLWAVNIWHGLLNAVEQREKWKRAQKWIEDQGKQGVDIGGVDELLRRLPWGMMIWAPVPSHSSIGIFADLLSSTSWLSESHIDVFASYLTFRIGGSASGLWIGGVHLAVLLKALPPKPDWKADNVKVLAHYENIFTTGDFTRLIFPANVNGNHWILFSVDVEKREFCFGSSSYLSVCN